MRRQMSRQMSRSEGFEAKTFKVNGVEIFA